MVYGCDFANSACECVCVFGPFSNCPSPGSLFGSLFSDKMVFIKPDIEAGTIQDQADLVTPAQYPEPDTDEEPDVEEIEVCVTCCVVRNK